MVTKSYAPTKLQAAAKSTFTHVRQKQLLRVVFAVVVVIYIIATLFPFYVLFVRSFVSTKEATNLHLWIPPAEELSMEAAVGNLAVFYDLDLNKLKEALGIPPTEFLQPRTTLQELAEKYNIPEEKIKRYFAGFYTYNGWITLLTDTKFWASMGRTLLITVVSLIGLTILSIFTGYGLAGLRRRDQMAIYNIYLLQMVIPGMLIIVPQFLVVQWLLRLFPNYDSPGITRWALQILAIILINIKGGALSTMIFTSAISAIPKEIEESAHIDGASQMQYLRHILLPLLKVPIVGLIVIMLPGLWNQFLEPYIYLDPNNTTLLPFTQSVVGHFAVNYQLIYSAVFASVIPLVVVYLIFRRFFIEGIMAGAVKG